MLRENTPHNAQRKHSVILKTNPLHLGINKHNTLVLDETNPLFLSLSSLLSSTLRALAEVTSVAASLSQTEERAVLLHRVAHSHELHLRSHLLHGHEHALELGRLLSLAALREHHQLALVRVQSLHVRLQGLHLSLNTHTRDYRLVRSAVVHGNADGLSLSGVDAGLLGVKVETENPPSAPSA